MNPIPKRLFYKYLFKVLWRMFKKQIICLGVGIVLITVGIIGLTSNHKDSKKSDKLYDDITASYTSVEEKKEAEEPKKTKKKTKTSTEVSVEMEGEDLPEEEVEVEEPTYAYADYEGEWYEWLSVDFEGLRKVNRDVVGWIFFENNSISYPILAGGDNTEYLRTSMTHEKATAGSIFIDCENEIDFNDPHTLIYGHNMKNNTMFGPLKNYYKDDSYYDGHRYFQILTKDKAYRYEIVAYKNVADNDPIYRVLDRDRSDFDAFAQNQVLGGSMIESPLEISSDDYVVTLSTCNNSGDARFVVCAVRIDEH